MPVNQQELPEWFAGKTIADLNAIEVGGRVLIPDAMRRVGPKGNTIEDPVLCWVPTEAERAIARLDAVKHVGKLASKVMGSPDQWTVARAQEAVGADVFENFDTAAIVARSLREPKAVEGKHPQWLMLDLLLETWPPSSWFDMYERLDFYSKLYNPRVGELSEDQFWAAVANISRSRNISPLGVMRGDLQSACIARMASELWSYRTRSLSSQSTETSTPG